MNKRIFTVLDIVFVCTWPITVWLFLQQHIVGMFAYVLITAHTGLICHVVVETLIQFIRPRIFRCINADNYIRLMRLHKDIAETSVERLYKDMHKKYKGTELHLSACPETIMELGLHQIHEGDWDKVNDELEGYVMALFAATYVIATVMEKLETKNCQQENVFQTVTMDLKQWDQTIRPNTSKLYYKGRERALSEISDKIREYQFMSI